LSESKEKMTHPDSDVLAEFRAGLITGRSGTRISAHLAACDRCTGVCDQLAEISTLLAAVPAAAMPDAVARRIESALAAEAMQRDSSERAVDPRSPDRATSPPPRRRWDFRLVALRVLAPAAAVVLLAAGGYGLSRIGSSSTSSVAAGSEASAASSAQPGGGAVPSSAASGRHAAAPAIEAPAKFGVVTSRTNYLRATLRQKLERELRLYPRAAGSPQELAPSSLRECVLLVTRGISPVTLLLVENAHFQGQPANVIIGVSGDHDVAWVTTPACSGGGDHILATATLPGTSAP
jgi:hypothetical protein